jgi:hypothetical protein
MIATALIFAAMFYGGIIIGFVYRQPVFLSQKLNGITTQGSHKLGNRT